MAARRVAVEVLLRVERGGAFASLALDAAMRRARLAPRDRALATEITYGALRWRGRLDWVIEQAAERPLERIALPVRCILRAAAYQVLFLKRVPPYAAVDQAVRQAREMRSAGAAGFVNGVLRRIARTGGNVAYPDPGRDPAAYLAAYGSLPGWIAQRWVARLGLPEATELALACNATPAIGYTSNILKGSAEEARRALEADLGPMEPGRWAPGAFHGAAGVGSPGESRAVRDGLAFVMDEAAVLPVYLLGLAPGQRMLDACAGGGGKAAVAAGMLHGEGMIVALEPQGRALRRLREACARLGLHCVHPVQAEAQRAGAVLRPGPEGGFDAVLVDAPCTGLGTLRRHPEIKWRIAPDDVGRLAAVQREILAGAAPCVRPGGVLVYATCTTEPEENEDVVEAFLASHPDFQLEDAGPCLPARAAGLGAKGYLRAWPHLHGTDGFFAARLRRGLGAGGRGSGTRPR